MLIEICCILEQACRRYAMLQMQYDLWFARALTGSAMTACSCKRVGRLACRNCRRKPFRNIGITVIPMYIGTAASTINIRKNKAVKIY